MTHNSMGDMKMKMIYYFGQKNALKIKLFWYNICVWTVEH